MSLEVRPLVPADFVALRGRLQEAQRGEARLLTPWFALACLDVGPAWTALDRGEPVAAAGLYLTGWPWPVGWALLAHDAGRRLVALTRLVRRALAPFEVVATGVRRGFRAGERWACVLGFVPTSRDLAPGWRLWLRRRGPEAEPEMRHGT